MGVVRKTKSVRILLELFQKSEDAISVVDLVKQFQDTMNKSTVYRILDRLEEENTIHSFTGKDGLRWVAKYNNIKKSDIIENHPHFQCKECGKMKCLPIDFTVPKLQDYKIDSANLILVGACGDCLT